MHEFPVTEQIIKIASEQAEKNRAKGVTRIHLVVGDSSGFIGESIQMYFDVISQGTICEGATLEIEKVKSKWKCPTCDNLYIHPPLSFACPKCGIDGEPTSIGKEFYIKSIEIEHDDKEG